jgi:AcrR family transcriptional regulator
MHPTATTSAPARQRRTQQERRETTRGALLEATVECLVELGYGATTTLEVERRAGVSRGARIHHFPTKALLLASAVDHLYHQLGSHYEQAFGHPQQGATDAERLVSGLRLLWSVYQQPAYVAVLELSMAARTDEELRARLREVALRHRALAVEAASIYFPAVPADLAERLVQFINATLLGLMMERNVIEEPERDRAVLALLQSAVAAQITGAAEPDSGAHGGSAHAKALHDHERRGD